MPKERKKKNSSFQTTITKWIYVNTLNTKS